MSQSVESSHPSPPASAPSSPRRRPRVILWACVAGAVVVAALIAVLASSKPVGQGSSSSPLIGRAAPPVSGRAIRGAGSYSLSQFASKWVLVNFSASWCEPCRAETPQLKEFQTEHAAAGNATILGVDYDPTDTANLAAFLRANQASWPVVADDSAEISYGIGGLPESYLVDPQGTVVAKYYGGVSASEVDAFISKAS